MYKIEGVELVFWYPTYQKEHFWVGTVVSDIYSVGTLVSDMVKKNVGLVQKYCLR
jgi:hypothetical protein